MGGWGFDQRMGYHTVPIPASVRSVPVCTVPAITVKSHKFHFLALSQSSILSSKARVTSLKSKEVVRVLFCSWTITIPVVLGSTTTRSLCLLFLGPPPYCQPSECGSCSPVDYSRCGSAAPRWDGRGRDASAHAQLGSSDSPVCARRNTWPAILLRLQGVDLSIPSLGGRTNRQTNRQARQVTYRQSPELIGVKAHTSFESSRLIILFFS